MKLNFIEFFTVNSPLRRLVQNKIEIKDFLGYETKVENKRVLEIGCGNGYGAKLIDRYFKPKEIVGIDLDQRMLDRANKNKLPNSSF